MKKNILLKSIILSLITISLTACGGGGGGGDGSSSGTPTISIPKPPQFDITVGTQGEIDKNVNIQGSLENGNLVTNLDGSINFNKELNKSTIIRNGKSVVGVKGIGKIVLNNGENIKITDEIGGNTLVKLEKLGERSSKIDNIFSLDGYSFGVYSKGGDVNISSNSKITLSGDSIVGIYGDKSKIINNGIIETTGEANNVIGIFGKDMSGLDLIINNGEINLTGKNVIGIKLYNATASNNETITINSSNGIGMSVVGNGSAINNKIININNDGVGIYAGYGASGKNNGIININGQGYGMYADNGAYILNEGTINLSSQAQGGMIADGAGSVAENKGTINVDSGSSLSKDDVVKAINGGRVVNSGKIIFKDKATIYSVDGVYTIGTSQDGSYGKIVAENIEIDGNVAIDSGIAKGSYKDSYTLTGVLEGSVEFGDNYKILSDSLLYDADITQGLDGNYDGKLERNDKVISDFTYRDYNSTAKIFDKYFTEEEYSKLTQEGKNLIDSINIENESNLRANIKDLIPTIYANNGRIISDIGDIFKEQREKTILSLEDYDYNFSFIGNHIDVDSKNIIEDYKSQMAGFVGTMKLKDNSYLSLGYGYTDIDYSSNSKGKIDSIHLGLDGEKKYSLFNFNYGIGGEYNFHEVDREMKSYATKGEADFKSYGVKTYGKVSTNYETIIDIEPYLSLDLGYYHIEDINEKSFTTINIASEDYMSIRPELGINLSKKLGGLKIYGGIGYSYELGDMDKRVDYSYVVDSNKVEIRDKQEDGLLATKVGIGYEKNSFTFGVEGGKNYGRRDNSFIKGTVGYRF